ncbi:hypothetical protein C5167_048307 [Papaver somniferum]|uniref:Uncharacterized protein n=1 Tax=Papaver somniferum TaxID=3469 RepID=A0A4Y7KIZ7_PAPSO|nr:hypothetical protein C5167_048307 [Papaver somniferum]
MRRGNLRSIVVENEEVVVKKSVVSNGKVEVNTWRSDKVFIERQKHDELRNPELEREPKKRIRTRRDDSDDKDKCHDDGRDASRQDDRYGESHHEDLDKDKQKDDRHRESYYEDLCKDKQKENRDSRGKKRYSDDLKSRNAKEHHHAVTEKKTPSSSRKGSPADRGRSQSRYYSTASRSRCSSLQPQCSSCQGSVQVSRKVGFVGPHECLACLEKESMTSSKAESHYREPVSDERVRSNGTSLTQHSSVHGFLSELLKVLQRGRKPFG